MNEWDIKPNEQALWWNRFNIYKSLGPRRTIEEAFRRDLQEQIKEREEAGSIVTDEEKARLFATRPGAIWYKIINEFEWEARSKAWDALKAKEREEKDEKDKESARAGRRATIRAAQQLFAEYLKELRDKEYHKTLSPYNWNMLSSAMKAINEDSRKEYGDEISKHELTGKDGGPIETKEQTANIKTTLDAVKALLEMNK